MIQDNIKAKKKLIQLAETVLQTRYQVLINSASKKTIEMYQIQKIREGFIKNQSKLEYLTYDIVMFQVSLIINGTKGFEAFSLNNEGEKRFNYTKENLRNTIFKNTSSIQQSLFHIIVIKTLNISKSILLMNQMNIIEQLIFQQQTPMEPLDEKDQSTQQKALKAFDYRLHLYFKTIDQGDWAQFNDLITQISEQILQIENQPPTRRDFQLSVVCAGKRILEQNSRNVNGIPYFPDYIRNPLKYAKKDLNDTLNLLAANINIQPISKDNPLIQIVKKNLKKNKSILQQIFGQIEFKEKYIDEYFKEVEIFSVDQLVVFGLYGLSHPNGSIMYIDRELFMNMNVGLKEVKKFKQPTQFIKLSQFQQALVVFEHESTHNILRFVIKNKRLCFISPKYHTQLKYKGKPIEAGFYYEYQAYNIIPDKQGPFCLNSVKK